MYRLIRGVTLAMEGLVRRSDLRPGLHFLLADLEDLATGGGDQLWGLPGALQGRCCHCRRCPRGPAQAEGALWGRGSSHARWRGWGRCMGVVAEDPAFKGRRAWVLPHSPSATCQSLHLSEL